MSNRIKPLRRTGSTGQPNIVNMQEGEIAVNSYDQKIWMRVGSNLVEIANAGGSTTWGEVTGKPSTFPPSAHTHSADDITSGVISTARLPFLQGNMDNGWARLNATGDSAVGGSLRILTGGATLRYYHDNVTVWTVSQYGDMTVTGNLTVSGSAVWHAGNFNPDDKADDGSVVKTSGNQTGLSGNKTWTGSHQFNNDLRIGTDTDSTSNTRLLTVSSNGFAGLFLNGDASNTSGEPGGSFISLGTDGGAYNTGATNLYVTSINEAGSDGMGGTWPGTTSNSGLIGIPGNYRLQFGINSQINFYCASNQSVVFNGDVEVATSISTLNGGLTLAGSTNANRRLSFTNTSGVSTSAIESHSTGGLSIWGGDESLTGSNFIRLIPRGQHSDTAGLRVNVGGNTAIDGSLTVGGTVTATNLTATSDPRLKANKQKTKARRELIEKLEYWSFEWKKDGTKGRSVMADKVLEIAPEHVHIGDDEDKTLAVDKGGLALEMVFALIDMLKEQEDASSN